MPLQINNEGIVLEATDLPFENQGVFNPACIEIDGIVHMFYRAVRSGNHSTIGYCQLKDNKVIARLEHPLLKPEHDYELQGVEDPRIILLDNTYYVFYTAYDGKNASGAYATSPDLVTFTKQGIITPQLLYQDARAFMKKNPLVPPLYLEHADKIIASIGPEVLLWDKDLFMFPKRINGKFWLGHRLMPSIQLTSFKDFSDLTPSYWENHLENLHRQTLMHPKFDFENHHIGGGCPPLETKDGWLLIYHGVSKANGILTYSAGVALLDLENPQNVIGRLPYPLFVPTTPWEIDGTVDNIVFPTGAIIQEDKLSIYYGAADTCIGCKSLSLSALLDELKQHPATL